MHKTLESLKKVFSENHLPLKDALLQLSFTAIQAVNSVRHPSVFELATLLSSPSIILFF